MGMGVMVVPEGVLCVCVCCCMLTNWDPYYLRCQHIY
jgi:hypothetical protein